MSVALNLSTVARALGGEVSGGQVLAPGPGHSPKDRSLSVKPADNADGFIVYSHAEDDPLACKDHVRSALGRPAWEPARQGPLPLERMNRRAGAVSQALAAKPFNDRQMTVGGFREVAAYDYRAEDGELLYQVVRYEHATKPKTFLQRHPDGLGGWLAGSGDRRVLYKAHDRATVAHTTIFVCEGEKDADRLAGLGFLATTVASGKWTPDLAAELTGYECFVLEDNDEAGRAKAAKAAAVLTPVAESVRIVRLPNLGAGGDVSDWLKDGGDPGSLVDLARAAPLHTLAPGEATAPLQLLALIDPANWENTRSPPREWSWMGLIPARQATLLTGAGSSGKSLLGQQLATCTAAGLPCLGVGTRQTVSLYLTCEDDADELHRRQEAICDLAGVTYGDLSRRLHLVSLAGAIGNELVVFDSSGRMETTAAWERLRATVLQVRPGFIVLDNIAHLFAGNENDRHQVASFCGLLNSLALEAGAAVLFIGHPNKAGAAFSGSTAWENQVRSRLFLERPQEEDGSVLDPDARVLSLGKANYARNGESIAFRWYHGAFTRPEEMPQGEADGLASTIRMRAEEDRFLACLAKATAEQRAVSTSKPAPNYAPRIFAAMPAGKGVGEKGFEAAMERLLDQGAILAGQPVYRRANRQWVSGIGVAPTLAPTPAPSGAPSCTKPEENP